MTVSTVVLVADGVGDEALSRFRLLRVVENKRLSKVLAHVKARQAAFPDSKWRGAARRRRTVNNLEAPGAPSGIGPQCHLYFARAMTSLSYSDMRCSMTLP